MDSADDQTKYNAQSTNKLQEIWAEKPKSKTLPVFFADGIGKTKDLNCKIIFLKQWKIFKILFFFICPKFLMIF